MNIGTIGTGSIVDTFLSAISEIDGVTCVALYSRKRATAEPLAKKYQIDTIYTDLGAMFANPCIDFIYIASPNSLHYEHAYNALQHGKHVICEKPFTSTVRETDDLIKLAKRKNLMLFEAISNIHMPNYKLIKELLPKLGTLKFIQCNYSQYSSKYNRFLSGETPNVFSPKYSGGALMDINIYNLHFVMNLFGVPETISYTANKHANGIDTSGILLLKYPDLIAECVGCKDTNSMNFALIQGEKGFLHVEKGAQGCQKLILHIGEQEVELNLQTNENRLYYELEVFRDIFNTKDFEGCYKLLDHTRSVMSMLERARKDAEIVFEADR
jgi:scyllo-inositol 2-dehydrogenase (NADP+)